MGLFDSFELKKLRAENEDLKIKFERIASKESNIQHLEEVLKRLRLEVSELNKQKNSLKESISTIELEEVQKRASVEELNSRIEHLNSLKEELENQIFEYQSRLEELKNGMNAPEPFRFEEESTPAETEDDLSFITPDFTPEETFETYEEPAASEENTTEEIEHLTEITAEANEKLEELKSEEQKLLSERDAKLSEIEALQNKAKEYIFILDDIEGKIKLGKERILALKQQEEQLASELTNKQNEIASLQEKMQSLHNEFMESEQRLQVLKQEELDLISKVENFKELESTKINHIRELDSYIAQKDEIKSTIEIEHQKLMDELNESKKVVDQARAQYEFLIQEYRSRKKDLFDTEQTLSIKAQKLSSINIEVLDLEKKNSGLKSELSELEQLRNTIRSEIQKEKDIADKFTNQNKKLIELVPLLEKRKVEIEQSNAELEERFTIMFRKFNNELNEINKKRNLLEQIVLQKEKDVDEKDQLLFEKIAALEESESVLNTRKIEMESLEQMVASLLEQKEMFKTDLHKMEEEVIERKNYNQEIKLESDLLLQKKTALEKGLQDLLNLMNESYSRSKDRNNKFETELAYYEEKLQDFRNKIAESMREMEDLRNSVSSLKVEKQEYKSNVEKLGLMKKRLQEEILKHQTVLQRYQKIRERLKVEQPLGKSHDEGRTEVKAAVRSSSNLHDN